MSEYEGKHILCEKRIAELEAENTKLKRIIAEELTENDELGSEFVYVQALKGDYRAGLIEAAEIAEAETTLETWDDDELASEVEIQHDKICHAIAAKIRARATEMGDR